MTLDEYNEFCASLPATTHVVQWGNSDVWKVGGKFFAMAHHYKGEEFEVTFKVTEIAFEILPQMEGLRPAPYLASRGMKWIQHYRAPGLDDEELRAHITRSHELVAAGLTKRLQRELGLLA